MLKEKPLNIDFTQSDTVLSAKLSLPQLLLIGDLTIVEVAVAVGFAIQGHLNYHFKRLVGLTPKTFLLQ